ncbi:MAG: biotin--[acetyl-CoA-carboxylase] ligase [Candidatus Actinomarina sp.]|jgi:BirA family biotin operon repressor/biotin-[acetyl-CoA-carboxylase] ligase|nr:biotin--[acetyl-CoA-carboxylase] ligase [Actinomycetota bacterium]MBL6833651.1 biotin--[acetyl-CoA-carboxylase] ligase [Candidatus Actinomarina sp.]MBL6837310.1 biotin--[acetyl-CoA-carboxylase] ligase [Candidatus Actinomarina sp.]MDB2326603.1 biotin--[acetyl-CoA-carboxylase] ligase [Candidatus Actinomarina sp.]MDB4823999.1 biotin--[acetyl-CoA-carboxylase] ligase [Acidimicrobiia bacterium]|tara:strand:- start:109 stop:765 length:657 start_codon:yes stop_codon:yes gene_type:complete
MKVVFFESIHNTQDYALENFEAEPLLVISYFQEKGRGTDNKDWQNADQALACSLVFTDIPKPFTKTLIPLISGNSFIKTINNLQLQLKWPNDIVFNDSKVGGVLVEEKENKICIGMGINYFWDTPELPNAASLYEEKIDNETINQDATTWAEHTLDTIQNNSFDFDEYKSQLTTLGKLIEYPEGRGWARDIAKDGSLVVETISGEMINLTSPLISEVK